VASALDCAHRQGIIHRDIKPENILLQEGEAVVADFGIARAVSVAGGERLTETGLSLGTPAYMSPEQASGDQKIDSRSDIYSLASVMYEMLAGEPPFTGPTTPAIIARQLVDPVPSIRTVRPTVPEELERAIEKALAKVPADRYDSAGAFVEAADAAAQVEVVPTRERRMPRRQVSPKAWSVGAAVALTATAAITAGVMLLSSDRTLTVHGLEHSTGHPCTRGRVGSRHLSRRQRGGLRGRIRPPVAPVRQGPRRWKDLRAHGRPARSTENTTVDARRTQHRIPGAL